MTRRVANSAGRGRGTASEVAALRTRVEEAEEILRALRQGEVDAVVGTRPSGEQIFVLEGAEHPYRVMVETMNEGAVTLAADGTILYANRHFAELVASKLERVIGSRMQEYLAPAEVAKFVGLMRQAAIDSTKDNVDLVRSDGSRFPSRLSMRRLGIDGAFEIITVITDLSELMQAEERQERLARIVETARCIIFATDVKGVITAWNRGAADMLGYTAAEIVGKSAEQLVADAQRADVAGLTAKAVAGETTPAFEAMYVAKDGHLVDVSLTMSPIRSRTGAVTGVSTIAFDVTARWRAEVSLREEKAFSDAVIESLPGTFLCSTKKADTCAGTKPRECWRDCPRIACTKPPYSTWCILTIEARSMARSNRSSMSGRPPRKRESQAAGTWSASSCLRANGWTSAAGATWSATASTSANARPRRSNWKRYPSIRAA